MLQPFLMGRWVSVHPLGVILAIARRRAHGRRRRARWSPSRWPPRVNAVVQHLAAYTEPGRRPGRGAGRGLRGDRARPRPTRRTTASRPGRLRRPRGRCGRWLTRCGVVTLADVEAAREVIRDVAIETPMEQSRWLSALVGGPVWLKCENLQRTGSFKIRGAYVRISRLTAEERARGVVAASAGNHAQGVALAAQLLGITVHRVHARGRADPQGAGDPRRTAPTWSSRARTLEESLVAARRFAEETGAVLIHPFDHVDIVAGQGTLRPRDPRAGARRGDRAGADRRRRAAGRRRDRGQGAAARRPGGRRPGGRRRGVPGLARAGRARCRWRR